MNDDLLPGNATPLEKALSGVSTKLQTLPVPMPALNQPEHCPEPLLPWLAWSLSIDHWQDTWSVETKRRVLAGSIAKHRKKGTVSAVKQALLDLGITAQVTEWWQQTPKGIPHTFAIQAWANDNGVTPAGEPILNPGLYQTLQDSVNAQKPVRSHYTFQIGAHFSQMLKISGALTGWQKQRAKLSLSLKPRLASLKQGIALSVQVRSTAHLTL